MGYLVLHSTCVAKVLIMTGKHFHQFQQETVHFSRRRFISPYLSGVRPSPCKDITGRESSSTVSASPTHLTATSTTSGATLWRTSSCSLCMSAVVTSVTWANGWRWGTSTGYGFGLQIRHGTLPTFSMARVRPTHHSESQSRGGLYQNITRWLGCTFRDLCPYEHLRLGIE